MKRGKRAFLCLIVLFISIISIIGVSAGWWSSLTGNVAKSSTAKGDVSGIAQAPKIWFVSNPDSTSLVNANNNQGVSYHSFSFLACSIGGVTVLPDNAEVAAWVTLYTGFNGTYGSIPLNFAPATVCSVIGDVALLPLSGCNGQSRNYTCTVGMRYYYDPITWNINVTIRDSSSNFATNSSRTFSLNPNIGWDTIPTDPEIYVNWSGVTVGGADKISDNNITITPIGNIDVGSGGLSVSTNPLQVNATPLNGTTITNQQILGSDFKSGGSNACTSGISLLNNQYVIIANFLADHRFSTPIDTGGSAINSSLTFCLTTLTGIEAQTYETNPLAKWTLNTITF